MIQTLNLGSTPNDKTGTTAREAGLILNNNFSYIENAIKAQLVYSTIINDVTSSSTVPATGNIHAIGVGPGTYVNWGGMVIPANNIGTLQRVGTVYSVSLTNIDISGKLNISDVVNTLNSTETAKPLSAAQGKVLNEKNIKIETWTAKTYLLGDQVNYLGKDWISNAAIIATDVPGTSAKWVDMLSAKLDVSSVVNSLTSTDATKPLSAAQGKILSEKSSKTETWTAKTYLSGDQSNYLGKDWVASQNTLVTDIPGTSAKWQDRLSGYAGLDVLKTGYQENAKLITNFRILPTGATSSSSLWRMATISVNPGDVFTYYGDAYDISGTSISVGGYDSNGVFISALLTGIYSDSGVSFTVPAGVAIVKACSLLSSLPLSIRKETNTEIGLNTIPTLTPLLKYYNDIIRNGYEEISLTISDRYIKSDGTFVVATTWSMSQVLNVVAGEKYIYYGNASTSNIAVAVVAYDSNNVTLNSVLLGSVNSTNGTEFTIPVGVKKIRVCSNDNTVLKLRKVTLLVKISAIENIISTIATTVDTNLAPIRNGFESPALNTISYYLKNDGTTSGGSTWLTSGFISVVVGDVYKYVGTTEISNVATAAAVIGYNSSNVFVSVILFKENTAFGVEFTIPAGVSNIRVSSHTSIALQLQKVIPLIQQTGVSGLVALKSAVDTLAANIPPGGPILTNKSWTSIGDSITWQDGLVYASTTNVARGYQTLVKEKFIFTSFLNRGWSGYPLSQSGSNNSILSTLTALGSFDIYTLLVGTNDFKLNIPLGTTSDYLNNTGGTTFFGALRLTIDSLYSKNNNCEIIFLTPLRRNNDNYTSFSTNTASHKLEDYCNAIRYACEREALKLIDLYNYSGITEKNLTIKTKDGLHPNDDGYKLISKPIIQVFKELFSA